MKTFCNPNDAKHLVGKRVLASNEWEMLFASEGVLTKLYFEDDADNESPFVVNGLCYRFICEESEGEYRPFASAEEFKPYRDKWLTITTTDQHIKPHWYDDKGIGGLTSRLVPYDIVLRDCRFEDGSKCGVPV